MGRSKKKKKNKAGYKANTSCGRVGRAEMRVFTLSNSITTDIWTNGWTDGRTDKASYSRHESLVQWISATSATVGLQVFCYDFFIFGYANVRFLMGNPSSEHPSPLGLDDKNLSKNIVYKRRPFSTKG